MFFGQKTLAYTRIAFKFDKAVMMQSRISGFVLSGIAGNGNSDNFSKPWKIFSDFILGDSDGELVDI